jgi:hypothetical protein
VSGRAWDERDGKGLDPDDVSDGHVRAVGLTHCCHHQTAVSAAAEEQTQDLKSLKLALVAVEWRRIHAVGKSNTTNENRSATLVSKLKKATSNPP